MTKFWIAIATFTAANAAFAQTATYAVDPTHTFVIYETTHFATSTNRGRFAVKDGSVQLDRAAQTGKADITIDIASVNTGVPALDKHLLSEDFFSAAKFPTGRFVADKMSFKGKNVSSVSGTLTLLGQSHPATLKAHHFNCYENPMLKREVCGGDFETTIKRSQWGVLYGLNYGFPDDTRLLIQIEAIKQ